jgi:hypothetical protein
MRLPLAVLWALQTAVAAAAVSFAPPQNYPNIGFSFSTLDHAKADPLPMPQAQTVVVVDSDALSREDRFAPFELWYANQCCGRWYDAQSNRLVIGRMTAQLPTFGDETVTRDTFSEGLSNEADTFDPKSDDAVNEWVATFVDATVYKPQTVKVNAFNLDAVRIYPCDAPGLLIYAFRPRRIGNAKSFDWFCVTLQATGGGDPKALRELFENQFLDRITLPNRASKDDGAQSQEVSVRRSDDATVDLADSPVRTEARKSIENYEAWWFAETDGYIIISDANTSTGKFLVREIQRAMPAMHAAYEKLVPPLTTSHDVSLIRIFQSRADYVRYAGHGQEWTGAVWIPGRRELVLTVGDSTEETMRTLRHEAFHQYLSYAYCMIPASPWMNEGHACFFEEATVKSSGKVTLGEDATRADLILDNIDAVATLLPQLFQADYPAFYGGTTPQRDLKYAMAWGVIYYLQKGAPQERNTPFKTLLADYAAALKQTHDYGEASKRTCAALDMNVFQDNFREFWQKRRASAIQFDPLDN